MKMKNTAIGVSLGLLLSLSSITALNELSGEGQSLIRVAEAAPAQGKYIKDGRYIEVTNKNGAIWQNFNWKKKSNTSSHVGKTYQARGRYKHKNGQTYYTLYNSKGQWQGYMNSRDGKVVGAQGSWKKESTWVQVKGNKGQTYSNFNWSKRERTENLKGQVFQATGSYNHYNGAKYYSVTDKSGKWRGYINARDLNVLGAQGPYISDGRLIEVTNKNGVRYRNFNWAKSGNTSGYVGQTFTARGRYDHTNGQSYYSIYDKNGTWHGYLNSRDAKITTGQGPWNKETTYIRVNGANGITFSNFNFKKRENTQDMKGQVLQATGSYNHFNGQKYFSAQNKDGKWRGYINSKDVTVLGPQGEYINDGRRIEMRIPNGIIYNDFNWNKKAVTGDKMGQEFIAKGRYEHLNGTTYYSIYDLSGNWHGYVQSSYVQNYVAPKPVEPVKPVDPKPVDPVKPTEPSKPVNPKPTEPTKPDGLSDEELSEKIEVALTKRINDYRKSIKAPVLQGNDKLRQAADVRSKEIHTLFDHQRPDGRDTVTAFTDAGLSSNAYWGENLIVYEGLPYDDDYEFYAEQFFLDWKGSPGHNANMRNNTFNAGEVSVNISNGEITVAHLFYSIYWLEICD